MNPTTTSAIIGGASSLIGGLFRNRSAKKASARQMAFQERMSNTQYQRAVADMEKAGINPMLAVSQGGAGNVSGSTYQPENVGAAMSQGIAQGAQSYSAKMQGDLTKELAKQERDLTEYLQKNNITIGSLKYTAENQAGSEAWNALKTIFDPDPKAVKKLPGVFQDVVSIAKKFLIQEGFAVPTTNVGVIPSTGEKTMYGKKSFYPDERGNETGGITLTGKTPNAQQAAEWLGILKIFRIANAGGLF